MNPKFVKKKCIIINNKIKYIVIVNNNIFYNF